MGAGAPGQQLDGEHGSVAGEHGFAWKGHSESVLAELVQDSEQVDQLRHGVDDGAQGLWHVQWQGRKRGSHCRDCS